MTANLAAARRSILLTVAERMIARMSNGRAATSMVSDGRETTSMVSDGRETTSMVSACIVVQALRFATGAGFTKMATGFI
jgi:hypothetical protein